MTELAFRNVDASPEDRVESWPYEALVTAIERGYLSHWRRIANAVRLNPWGQVARDVLTYAGQEPDSAVASLLAETVRRARGSAEAAERAEVAERVRQAISRSRLSAAEFAARIGTSASRLSTYATGKVVPSAAMLVRIEKQ